MTGAQPGSSQEGLIIALFTRLTSTERDVAENPYAGTVQANTKEASFSAGRSRIGTAGMEQRIARLGGQRRSPTAETP